MQAPPDEGSAAVERAPTPTKFFKRKQLFVEMDELRGDVWRETHRWNFGLEEDLDEDGEPVWNHPHLPWVSVFGLTELMETLGEENVMLDVDAGTYIELVEAICDGLVARGALDPNAVVPVKDTLLLHDTRGLTTAMSSSSVNGSSNKPKYGYRVQQASSRPRRRTRTRTKSASSTGSFDGGIGNGIGEENDSDDLERAATTPDIPPPTPPRGQLEDGDTNANSTITHTNDDDEEEDEIHTTAAEDAEEFEILCPEELEEAVDVLVGSVPWLEEDICIFVRLKDTLDLRIERHAPARFFAVILGPPKDEDCVRHIEMAEGLAALLQDEEVVSACYNAAIAADVLDAFDVKMHKLTLLPHIHRPTARGVKKRAFKLHSEMAEISGTGGHHQLEEWDWLAEDLHLDEGVTLKRILRGLEKYAIPLLLGVVIAMVLKNTEREWHVTLRTHPLQVYNTAFGKSHHGDHGDHGDHGAHFNGSAYGSLAANGSYMGSEGDAGEAVVEDPGISKHVIDLITNGMDAVVAVVGGDAGEHADDDGHGGESHSSNSSSIDVAHDVEAVVPTFFTFEINGHVVNLHFIVNDIFMCFHFGLATVEIVESFLPGAILYPPTIAAVNPLGAALGGVLGPIAVYFILLAIFDAAGAFEGESEKMQWQTLKVGWGIPSVSDMCVGWSTALLVFGRGHPAIMYLLLLAIVEEAFGMFIIAIFYPDPDTPFDGVWLLLIVGAMVLSYVMRWLNVLDWRIYVAIPGSMAWFGMLWSSLHPALALVFVVPFMPTGDKNDVADGDDGVKKLDSGNDINYLGGLDLDAAPAPAHGHEEAPAKAPLYEFQHSCRSFTDLLVLFLFGLVNAGVDTSNGVGPYAWVVVLALIIGKLIGIGVAGICMAKCGFPLPKGMSYSHVLMVSFIAGCGLTVSLFMAGEAFEDEEVQGQGKLGALLSVVTAVLAIVISKLADFRTLDTTSTSFYETVADGGGGNGDAQDEDESDDESDDEFLEHIVAINQVDQLREVHRHVKEAEKKTEISRAEMQRQFRERLHELEREHHKEEEREQRLLERIGEIHRVHSGPHGPHHLDEQHDVKPHRVRSSISISKYESPFRSVRRPTPSRAQVGYDMATAVLKQQQQQHVVLNVGQEGVSSGGGGGSNQEGDDDVEESDAGNVHVTEV